MGYIDAIILGIVQGITEFLPISSSGHLVIFEHLLNINMDNVAFEVFVHFGTLLSVVAVYFNDIWNMIASFFRGITHRNVGKTYRDDPFFRLSIFVIIGTIPTAIAGLFLEDFFVSIFHNIQLVGITLLITGIAILSTRFIKPKTVDLTPKKSLLIGIAQSIAILPGISRSGFTISCALFSGMSRENAARFSFLLAIPAILGATLLHIVDLFSSDTVGINIAPLLAGFLCSFVVGYMAIRFLLSVLKSGKFVWFAPYCFFAGLVVLLFIS
ncbi:MAG: undecaprenyl-diphosphatase UppP [Candidatus Marinimicrobia bacterium]|nr:undecaprenyl-diphosphatase UppP [Candidatus Neomarinimicrobiota bacterium]